MANSALDIPFPGAESHSSSRDFTFPNFGRCTGLVGFLTDFSSFQVPYYPTVQNIGIALNYCQFMIITRLWSVVYK